MQQGITLTRQEKSWRFWRKSRIFVIFQEIFEGEFKTKSGRKPDDLYQKEVSHVITRMTDDLFFPLA